MFIGFDAAFKTIKSVTNFLRNFFVNKTQAKPVEVSVLHENPHLLQIL
jgi:hypothetical protein